MPHLREKIESMLLSRIPEEGTDPMDIYGDLYHGEMEGLVPIILEAMHAARDAGKMRPCPNNGGHDFMRIELWDRFMESGTEGMYDFEVPHVATPFLKHLSQTYLDWVHDPEGVARQKYPDLPGHTAGLLMKVAKVERIIRDHIPVISGILARELEEPRSRPLKRIETDLRSAVDNRPLELRFHGWEPVLYESLPDYSGVRRTEIPVLPSPARHYEISTNGKLLVMGIKDFGGIFAKAMRKAVHGLPYISIQSHQGANESALRDYAATGFLEIYLGDHFPQLVRDGEVIRGAWVSDEEDLPEGLETLFNRSLHMPVMACLDQAIALVEHLGMDVEKALDEISEDKGNAAGVIDVPPGPLHIYGPDGWRVGDFDQKFRPEGLTILEENEDCFHISSKPLDGDSLDVEMPEAPRFDSAPSMEP